MIDKVWPNWGQLYLIINANQSLVDDMASQASVEAIELLKYLVETCQI